MDVYSAHHCPGKKVVQPIQEVFQLGFLTAENHSQFGSAITWAPNGKLDGTSENILA